VPRLTLAGRDTEELTRVDPPRSVLRPGSESYVLAEPRYRCGGLLDPDRNPFSRSESTQVDSAVAKRAIVFWPSSSEPQEVKFGRNHPECAPLRTLKRRIPCAPRDRVSNQHSTRHSPATPETPMKYGRLFCAATLLIACTNDETQNANEAVRNRRKRTNSKKARRAGRRHSRARTCGARVC
jgi:hypothetical protein